LDKKKILIMTRMALYDKKYAEIDKKRLSCFRDDYVYRKNFVARFYALIGTIILLAVSYASRIYFQEIDPFELNFQNEMYYIIKVVAFVLILYTVIGGLKHNYEYSVSEKRNLRYIKNIERLEKLILEKSEDNGNNGGEERKNG